MEDCPICHLEIKEKVFMTCNSKHAFCFECILKSVESTKELKNCPMCRGGENKYILMDNIIDDNSVNFYSVSKFKKSIPIIQKILGIEISQNSCLVSDELMLTYVKNKKQLEFAHVLSDTYPIDEIFPVIKWAKKQETNGDLLNGIMGSLATELFMGGGGAPFQQYMMRY